MAGSQAGRRVGRCKGVKCLGHGEQFQGTGEGMGVCVVVADEGDEVDQGQIWGRAQSRVLESVGFTLQEVGYHSRGGNLSGGDVKGKLPARPRPRGSEP